MSDTRTKIKQWYMGHGMTNVLRALPHILTYRDEEELYAELTDKPTFKPMHPEETYTLNQRRKFNAEYQDKAVKRKAHPNNRRYGRGDRKGTGQQKGKKQTRRNNSGLGRHRSE